MKIHSSLSFGLLLLGAYAAAETVPPSGLVESISVPLPETEVVAPEIIYHRDFAVTGKNDLGVQYSYLYGDKYLNTMGLLLSDRYHLNETYALGLGLGIYKSSTSSEFQTLAQEPYVYDPKLIVKLTGVYDPFYGKILMGSQIVHFRLDVEGGLFLANVTSQNSALTELKSFIRVGPTLGLNAVFYTFSRFEVSVGTDLLIASASPLDPRAGARKNWLFNLGLGVTF